MFCPVCECEYLEGVKYCKDCRVLLVESLMERELHQPDQPGDLVLLRRYGVEHEAHLAKGLLEANGIAAIVSNEDFLGVRNRPGRDDIGGIRLLVAQEDLKDAEELFRQSGIPTEKVLQERPHDYYDPHEKPSQGERRFKIYVKVALIISLLTFLVIILSQFLQSA